MQNQVEIDSVWVVLAFFLFFFGCDPNDMACARQDVDAQWHWCPRILLRAIP